MRSGPIILLIEDEENDAFLFRRALSACNSSGRLHVVANGRQARDYLENRGDFSNREYHRQPALIVGNFDPLAANGFDFLSWLGEQSPMQPSPIPLVVWSASPLHELSPKDFPVGVTAHYVKTRDFAQLCTNVAAMLQHIHAR